MEILNKKLLDIVVGKIQPLGIETILEIGSRDGDDSNYLKTIMSLDNNNVYIVEPNILSFKKIKSKYSGYTLYNIAINDYDGICEFNNVEDDNFIGISSIKDRVDNFYEKKKTKKTKIICKTGKTLLREINKPIDYCQIDVEGMGYEVLESFGDSIKMLRFILIESEHKIIWEKQKIYDDIEILLNKTHNLIYTDYAVGNTQSNTLWEIKK